MTSRCCHEWNLLFFNVCSDFFLKIQYSWKTSWRVLSDLFLYFNVKRSSQTHSRSLDGGLRGKKPGPYTPPPTSPPVRDRVQKQASQLRFGSAHLRPAKLLLIRPVCRVWTGNPPVSRFTSAELKKGALLGPVQFSSAFIWTLFKHTNRTLDRVGIMRNNRNTEML